MTDIEELEVELEKLNKGLDIIEALFDLEDTSEIFLKPSESTGMSHQDPNVFIHADEGSQPIGNCLTSKPGSLTSQTSTHSNSSPPLDEILMDNAVNREGSPHLFLANTVTSPALLLDSISTVSNSDSVSNRHYEPASGVVAFPSRKNIESLSTSASVSDTVLLSPLLIDNPDLINHSTEVLLGGTQTTPTTAKSLNASKETTRLQDAVSSSSSDPSATKMNDIASAIVFESPVIWTGNWTGLDHKNGPQ
jgi:hypothetical protein